MKKERHIELQVTRDNFYDFEYVILAGKPGYDPSLHKEYEISYKFWKKIWKRIMTHLVGAEGFRPEDFQNLDYISDIRYQGVTIAQMCHRLLDTRLSITHDISYFKEFKGKAADVLKSKNISQLITMEFNSVHPKFSQRRTGFSFVEASLSLSLRLAESLGAECCTGVPRTITGVQDQILKLNYQLIESGLKKYGCPVDVVLGFVGSFNDPETQLAKDFCDDLWTRRRIVASSQELKGPQIKREKLSTQGEPNERSGEISL